MKKLIAIPLLTLLAMPVMAAGTGTTTTRVYDSTEMIEPTEESYDETLDQNTVEQQRMEEEARLAEEERMEEEEAPVIDYSSRTRTDRERKALNTSSHASDDN